MVVDELTLLPRRNDAFELGLEVCLGLRVRVFAGQRAVQMIDGAEVVAVLARDDGELILRMARVGVQLGSQAVVSLGGAPVALLVLVDQLGLAVAGEVTEVDQRLVAGEEDMRVLRAWEGRAGGRPRS